MDLYEWLWYHLEFWMPPEDRRPFTFIMRDIYHQAPAVIVLGLGFFFYALGRFWLPLTPREFLFVVFSSLAGTLNGHLFWGKDYVPGEMPEIKVYRPSARVRAWLTARRA